MKPIARLLWPVIAAELMAWGLFAVGVAVGGPLRPSPPAPAVPVSGLLLGSALAAASILPWGWWGLARQLRPLEDLADALPSGAGGKRGAPGPERLGPSAKDSAGSSTLAARITSGLETLRQREREAREGAAELAGLLDTMVEGVLVVDDRQRIRLTNRAAGDLFGFEAQQAEGKRLAELVRSYELHEIVHRAITGAAPQRAELYVDHPRRRLLSVHVIPRSGSTAGGANLVAIDSSELRRLESLRQDFVANVSHELKTPLSAIKAYAETLAQGAIYDQRTNLKFVRGIEEQAERLHRLILDMLSLARIESGRKTFEMTQVDVDRVVQACLKDYQDMAHAQQVTLEYRPGAEGLRVRADEEGLRELLNNLVDNAIKYTPARGRVTVESQATAQQVVLTVADTGIGIGPEHLGRLFERFYRVDKARSRELGGTGLGLAIVKHLAQVFGGQVAVESAPQQGSRFSVHLVRA